MNRKTDYTHTHTHRMKTQNEDQKRIREELQISYTIRTFQINEGKDGLFIKI